MQALYNNTIYGVLDYLEWNDNVLLIIPNSIQVIEVPAKECTFDPSEVELRALAGKYEGRPV